MARGRALAAISELSAEQWGMVTAAQCRAFGVSRVDVARLVADSVIEGYEGAARVYRLTGSPPNPDLDGLRAAWLQLGGERPASQRLREPDAIASHRSAAIARGIGDLVPSYYEFIVTIRRQPRRRDLTLRPGPTLDPSDWTIVQGLPACTAARIVADLLDEREDESAIARICLDALRSDQLRPDELGAILARHARAYGHPTADSFIAALTHQPSLSEAGVRRESALRDAPRVSVRTEGQVRRHSAGGSPPAGR